MTGQTYCRDCGKDIPLGLALCDPCRELEEITGPPDVAVEERDGPHRGFSTWEVLRKTFGAPRNDEIYAYMRSITLADQLQNVRSWNRERGWGFSEAEFAAVERAAAESPHLAREFGEDEQPVLVPYLESVGRTFDELCAVASSVHVHVDRATDVRSDEVCLALIEAVRHEPGLSWEILALGAAYTSADHRGMNSAHAGVLAAVCHYPAWAYMLGSQYGPDINLAGYRARWDEESDWDWVPQVSSSMFGRTVKLRLAPSDTNYGCAPTRRSVPVAPAQG